MNIKIPQYNVVPWSDWSNADKSELEQIKLAGIEQQFLSCIRQEMNRFLYEPMNDSTANMIKESVVYQIHDKYCGADIHSVDVDDMRDLEYKRDECKACAETGSYEEYRIKRAAQNLPDDAGSESEWHRMSQYRPGQMLVTAVFKPAISAQEMNYIFKIT